MGQIILLHNHFYTISRKYHIYSETGCGEEGPFTTSSFWPLPCGEGKQPAVLVGLQPRHKALSSKSRIPLILRPLCSRGVYLVSGL